jgi:hypothetical protein
VSVAETESERAPTKDNLAAI